MVLGLCFVLSLPRGAMGWSAVCVIVAFPGHTHLLFSTIGLRICDKITYFLVKTHMFEFINKVDYFESADDILIH